MTTVRVELPPKLIPVFTGPALFRGAFGGRGSAKTRSFAKMAAVRGIQFAQEGRSGIIVCGREFQNSLDESSMEEVKSAIESEPWLAERYDIGERYIRTIDRRVSFAFIGLRHNLNSVKSKSKVLLLWVDEAEPVSEVAWSKAIPTVREEGAEIWATWNPEVDGSATDKRFRKETPPQSKIIEINYQDNPWFPDVLRAIMEYDRARDPEKFEHIWGGGYITRSEATVFRNWRIGEVDVDQDIRPYYGADWGFAIDPSVLLRCYVLGRTLYIDQELYKVGCEIDNTPLFFGGCQDQELITLNRQAFELLSVEQRSEWTGIPQARKWPIRADSARPDTISYMRKHGFPRILGARKGPGSIEDGIEFLKSYDIVIHPRCKHTIAEFTHYCYKVDKITDEVLPVLVDAKNHTIDSARYALESLRRAQRGRISIIPGEAIPLAS